MQRLLADLCVQLLHFGFMAGFHVPRMRSQVFLATGQKIINPLLNLGHGQRAMLTGQLGRGRLALDNVQHRGGFAFGRPALDLIRLYPSCLCYCVVHAYLRWIFAMDVVSISVRRPTAASPPLRQHPSYLNSCYLSNPTGGRYKGFL